MNSSALKLLVVCAIGAATLAGCASSPSSPATASAPRSIQSGKVAAVEATALVDQTVVGASSGSSAVVTSASGGPPMITVLFNDGTQGRYVVEPSAARHAVGEPVYVITDGDRTTIIRQ